MAQDRQSQILCGILNDNHDPDDFPFDEMMPDGFISFVGGAWGGSYENHGVVDMLFVLDKRRIKAMMTTSQARDLMDALNVAISAAEESIDFDGADENIIAAKEAAGWRDDENGPLIGMKRKLRGKSAEARKDQQ